MSWDQKLWGVKFISPISGDEEGLIGQGWHDIRPAFYEGEPLCRPLLFSSRRAARKWCREQREKYARRTDHRKDWQFIPVRVQFNVSVI